MKKYGYIKAVCSTLARGRVAVMLLLLITPLAQAHTFASRASLSLIEATSTDLCGVTCEVVWVSVDSALELNALSQGLDVNSQLYVNSPSRPNSIGEQKYIWNEKKNRYVAVHPGVHITHGHA